jgi:hypothetical protein
MRTGIKEWRRDYSVIMYAYYFNFDYPYRRFAAWQNPTPLAPTYITFRVNRKFSLFVMRQSPKTQAVAAKSAPPSS